MLADKPLRDLLDAFSSSSPTPGGGSAAALAGAIAASLLAMVAGMPKTKDGTPEDRAALDETLAAVRALQASLVALIDRDAASYDEVVAAYRLPKGTDAEKAARKQAVQAAMRLATDVPMETARAAAALVRHGRTVAEHGNPNAKSDVSVAVSLALTTLSGAWVNVAANLDGVGDAAYAAEVRSEFEGLKREAELGLTPTYEALGWKGHQPPA